MSISQGKNSDPCDRENYIVWHDPDGKLSAGTPAEPPYICHRPLEENWYRIDSPAGNDIPTTCVERGFCGTEYPMWLDGTYPLEGEEKFIDVKLTTGPCPDDVEVPDAPKRVRVKNCGDFRVYYLTQASECVNAYCFGNGARCPDGLGSETGWSPCTEAVPKIKGDVTVEQMIEWSERKFEDVKFTCQPSKENNFQEDIILEAQWFVRDQEGHDHQLATNEQRISESLLQEQAQGLNINLWCKLRARSPDLAPCPYVESKKRFLGMKMNPANVTLEDGGEANVTAELTFPFICYDSQNNGGCKMTLEIDIISNIKPTCSVPKVEARDLPYCHSEIEGIPRGTIEQNIKTQRATFTLTTGGAEEETITAAAVAYFSTQRIRNHEIWSFYATPRVDVNFLPSSDLQLTSSICLSRNDPHMTSFDQCRYENHVPGEQILYRNTVHGTQVNIFTGRCNYEYPRTVYCNCGVGVLSGRSHWILDRCNTNPSSQMNELIDCGDDQMKIYKDGNNYKIELRIGTVINVYDHRYSGGHFMNIEISPSSRDIGVSEGLCGNLNGRKDDDLYNRDSSTKLSCPNTHGSMSSNVEKFAESWRASTDESLYTWKKPTNQIFEVCACARDKQGEKYISCRKTWRTICVPSGEDVTDRYTRVCMEKNSKKKKREAGEVGSDYVDNERPPYIQPEIPPYQEPDWTGGWTEESARTHCAAAIDTNPASAACKQLPNAAHDVSLDQCVQDIKLSGGNTWVQDAVEAMKSACQNEATRNLSLWTEPAPGEAPGPPKEIMQNLCPNDCSGKGQCNMGVCECNEGYAEADCSVDIRAPPILEGTTGNCDFSTRPCRATPVFGDPFVNSPNLTCQIRVIELTSEGSVGTGDTNKYPAEFLDTSQVMCPLPWPDESRRKSASALKFGYGYAISVSNDGLTFSNETSILSYDSLCISCVNQNNCTLKENTCYINQVCYNGTKSRPGEECYQCVPQRSKTEWTWVNGCIIDNKCYLPGGTQEQFDCLQCDITRSNNSWTQRDNTCYIGQRCYNSTERQLGKKCYQCVPQRETDEWTWTNGCVIENTCYSTGDTKDGFYCLQCDPTTTNDSWTQKSLTCLIGGECFNDGAKHPTEQCFICSGGNNKVGWTSIDTCIGGEREITTVLLTTEGFKEALKTNQAVYIAIGCSLGLLLIICIVVFGFVFTKLGAAKRVGPDMPETKERHEIQPALQKKPTSHC